jgi:hypothetical protein
MAGLDVVGMERRPRFCRGRGGTREQQQQQEQQELKEQSGNVYENKGSLWKTRAEAGML